MSENTTPNDRLEEALRSARPEPSDELISKIQSRIGELGAQKGAENAVGDAARSSAAEINSPPRRRWFSPQRLGMGLACVLALAVAVPMASTSLQVGPEPAPMFVSDVSSVADGGSYATGGGNPEPTVGGSSDNFAEEAGVAKKATSLSRESQGIRADAPQAELAAPSSPDQSVIGPEQEIIVEPPRAPQPQGSKLARDKRLVQSDAQLSLAGDREEIDDIVRQIAGITERYDGVIINQQISVPDKDAGLASASLELEIPSASLQQVISEISSIKDTDIIASSGQDTDVTDQASSLTKQREEIAKEIAKTQEKLTNQRAELAESSSDQEKARLRSEISFTRAELDSLRAQDNSLEESRDQVRDQTSFSSLSISILDRSEATRPGPIGEAADQAVSSLETIVAGAVKILIVFGPFLLIGLVVFYAVRRYWRSREGDLFDR